MDVKDLWTQVSDEQLMRRIRGEYLEMPGLQLTRTQAQRLFGLSEQACAMLLNALVERKFLVRRPNGTYGRATDGNADAQSVVRERSARDLPMTA